MERKNKSAKRPKSAEPGNAKTKILRKLQAKKSNNYCYEVEVYRNRCMSAELYRKDEQENSDVEMVGLPSTRSLPTHDSNLSGLSLGRNSATDYYGRPLFTNFIFPDDDSMVNVQHNNQEERLKTEDPIEKDNEINREGLRPKTGEPDRHIETYEKFKEGFPPKTEDMIRQNKEIYEQYKRATKIPSRHIYVKETSNLWSNSERQRIYKTNLNSTVTEPVNLKPNSRHQDSDNCLNNNKILIRDDKNKETRNDAQDQGQSNKNVLHPPQSSDKTGSVDLQDNMETVIDNEENKNLDRTLQNGESFYIRDEPRKTAMTVHLNTFKSEEVDEIESESFPTSRDGRENLTGNVDVSDQTVGINIRDNHEEDTIRGGGHGVGNYPNICEQKAGTREIRDDIDKSDICDQGRQKVGSSDNYDQDGQMVDSTDICDQDGQQVGSSDNCDQDGQKVGTHDIYVQGEHVVDTSNVRDQGEQCVRISDVCYQSEAGSTDNCDQGTLDVGTHNICDQDQQNTDTHTICEQGKIKDTSEFCDQIENEVGTSNCITDDHEVVTSDIDNQREHDADKGGLRHPDDEGSQINGSEDKTSVSTDAINLYQTEVKGGPSRNDDVKKNKKPTEYIKSNKTPDRKSRSRFRNILVRRRNCVSPSPATHVEPYNKRSRSCPPISTCDKSLSDCTSSVCCINSVQPIPITNTGLTEFDSLDQINKNRDHLSHKSKIKRNAVSPSIITDSTDVQMENFASKSMTNLFEETSCSGACQTEVSGIDLKHSKSVPSLIQNTNYFTKPTIKIENDVINLPGQLNMPAPGETIEKDESEMGNLENMKVDRKDHDNIEKIDMVKEKPKRSSVYVCAACALKYSQNQKHEHCPQVEVESQCRTCKLLEHVDKNTKHEITVENNDYSQSSSHIVPNQSSEKSKADVPRNSFQKDRKRRVSNFRAILPFDENNTHSKDCRSTYTDEVDGIVTIVTGNQDDNCSVDITEDVSTNCCNDSSIADQVKSKTNYLCDQNEDSETKQPDTYSSEQPKITSKTNVSYEKYNSNENIDKTIQLNVEPTKSELQTIADASESQNTTNAYTVPENDVNGGSLHQTCETSGTENITEANCVKCNVSDHKNECSKDNCVEDKTSDSPSKSISCDEQNLNVELTSNVAEEEKWDDSVTDSEVRKLGKKCRSISSAHRERRRLGTPLTLILYVKKKCQAKIKKIMASKNNESSSVSRNNRTLREDTDEVLRESDEPEVHVQTNNNCDSNGNNIYRSAYPRYKNKFSDLDAISELRNVLKNGSRPLTEEEMVRLESFSRLDPSTLKVLGWSSGASEHLGNTLESPEQDDESMCKISRVEFKRLQEQVRDVSFNLRNRFRTSAYQKLYQQPHPTPLENTTQLYRSQLAASLRAFKPKEWPPLNSQDIETSYLRCKPINCQNDSHSSPSRCCSSKSRPKSVPPSAFRNRNQLRRPDTPTDVRPGNFDSLNPRVLSHLLSDTLTTSSYLSKNLPRPDNDEGTEEQPKDTKDDDVSTSGIESNPTDDTSSDDEDDSDFEPEVDENRLAPELYLRPEKLDSLVFPDSAKGWRKFDFDAENVNIPVYTFANPLPDPFQDLDLRQIARLKWNWRDQTRQRTREKNVDDILDRMVELERLQMETEDWEQKRSAQVNKRNSKRVASAKYPRDKRCCGKCLQPACTGDCPEKFVQSEVCELCRQTFCVKTCADTKYEQRMRQSRIDDKLPVPRSANPRYCKSCQSKHNAKIINANNIVLGRPKSSNSTYSRGQASNKPKDYRPRPETPVSAEMLQEFDKLGLEPQQPSRPTTAKMQRPRSRNSSFPSKSFYSQRRDSLTEADKNRFKKKQPKNKVLVRRPKTAV